jgi:hypothetical protein
MSADAETNVVKVLGARDKAKAGKRKSLISNGGGAMR